MPSVRLAIGLTAAIVATAVGAIFAIDVARGQKMQEIQFDLGKNIVETARLSGVPKFEARDVDGFVSYSVAGIPKEVVARFIRLGYEIRWQPVFAFTMYADRHRNPDMPVQTAVLQLDIRDMNDEAAQAFAVRTIAQFQKGKWKRYADPDWEVLLTGRSSYLNEAGEINSDSPGTPDPSYKLSRDDWLKVADSLRLRWVGDGVVAKLSINNSPGVDGKPAYRMTLEFESLQVKLQRDAENLSRDLKAGDAKGWNSTAKYEASKKNRQEINKRLASNALKRGDSVVSAP